MMILEGSLQRLGVGGQAGEADVELAVDFVDALEIGGDGLELDAETAIAGDGEAVLSNHSYQSTAIILKDLKDTQTINR